MLERVVREAFNQRRKTLRNTLKALLSNAEIEAAGVDGSCVLSNSTWLPSCAWPTSWLSSLRQPQTDSAGQGQTHVWPSALLLA